LDDIRILKLRTLIRDVMELQNEARKLLGEVNTQLQKSLGTADDRPERRKQPRA